MIVRGGIRGVISLLAAFVIFGVFIPTTKASNFQSQIQYGGMTAPNIDYIAITESSSTDLFELTAGSATIVGHYGTPSLEGNALKFSTPNFAASVAGGPDLDLTDGFLSFEMRSRTGTYISQVELKEFGSFAFSVVGAGSPNTMVDVSAPVFLTIYSVATANGSEVILPREVTVAGTMNVTPDQGNVSGWNSSNYSRATPWFGELTMNIPSLLQPEPLGLAAGTQILGATRIEFKMNNIMTALSADATSSSFIDKKSVVITPFVQPVPEPVSGTLCLSGLFMFAMLRRRSGVA